MRGLWLAAALVALSAGAAEARDKPGLTSSAQGYAEASRLMDEAAAALNAGDASKARDAMRQAAATGDPEAMNGYAIYLIMGIGGPPDPAGGEKLQEEALAKGSVGAALNIGLSGVQSNDVAKQRRGAELLRTAYADSKARPAAAAGLGYAYIWGAGVGQDIDKGLALAEEALAGDKDNTLALHLLGRAYQAGWGDRAKDPVKSLDYFRRAAALGHARSQREIGMAYLSGEGVEDDAQARSWYWKAVQHGSAFAMANYGRMLIIGEGGPIDVKTGMAFVELAAEAGDERAKRFMTVAELPTDAATRTAVDRLKRDWLAKHGAPVQDP